MPDERFLPVLVARFRAARELEQLAMEEEYSPLPPVRRAAQRRARRIMKQCAKEIERFGLYHEFWRLMEEQEQDSAEVEQ